MSVSEERSEKLGQISNHNMGPTRSSKEPVIAWGVTDTRTASPGPPKSNTSRSCSNPPRWRLPSGSENCRTSELAPSSSREKSSSETQPQDLNTADTPKTTDQLSSFSAGERGEEEDPTFSFPQSSSSKATTRDVSEEHVRDVQDRSDLNSKLRPSSQASTAFQETMVDLFGFPDYPCPPPSSSLCQIAIRANGAKNKFLALRRQRVGAEDQGPFLPMVNQLTMDNARRGRRVLRQYVQDQYLNKRSSPAALSWSMLRQTVKGVGPDKEKTRQDLYQRYGIVPIEDADGNVVKVSTMLSDRARETSCGSRPSGRDKAVLTRPPEGKVASESARGMWITPKRQTNQAKYLSSSLAAKISSPASASSSPRSSSSTRLFDGMDQRPGTSVARGGRGGVVRPSPSIGGRVRGTAGSSGGGGGLLPLRKISAPAFRFYRSLDS